MLIYVVTETARTVQIFVSSSASIESVKKQIEKKDIRINESYCLSFEGEELKDGRCLLDYNVREGDKLFLRSRGGMLIYVRTQMFGIIQLLCFSSDSIDSVKKQIEEMDIRIDENCCLSFEGEELEGGRCLLDYNVQENDVLFLRPRGSMLIYLVTENFKTSWYLVSPSDSIDTFKKQIEKGIRIAENYCLYFQEEELEDGRCLLDYKVQEGDRLFLRPRGNMLIYARTEIVGTICLFVSSSDSIESVKKKIEENGIRIDEEYCLYFEGEELEDGRCLLDYNVQKGDRLFLRPRGSIIIDVVTEMFGTIQLLVFPSDTIDSVKEKIEAKGIRIDEEYCLFFKREELKDGRCLSNYDVGDGVVMFLRQRGSMFIYVRTEIFLIIKLLVRTSDSIEGIKKKIQMKEDIQIDEDCCLIFKGKKLEDGRFLLHYNISDGAVLRMKIFSFDIFLTTDTKERIQLHVRSSDTIARVKAMVVDKMEIPEDEQKLYFHESELEDNRTLADYGIESESEVRLKRIHKVLIRVKTPTSKLLNFRVERQSDVKSLKKTIEDMERYLVQDQMLILGDQRLQEEKTIQESGIVEGSSLKLEISININVTCTSGSFRITTWPSETVARVKQQICNVRNVSFQECRLLFKEQPLSCDNLTVATCGIHHGSTLVLEKEVTLKILQSDTTFSVTSWPSNTIRDMKRKIEKMKNIEATNQRLLLQERLLDDELSIAELGFHEPVCLALELPLELFAKNFSREIRSYRVWPSDNVFYAKSVIAHAEGRAPSDLLLLQERTVLQDNDPISNLGVSRMSPLQLLERPRGFFIIVWDVEKDDVSCVPVEIETNVREVKEKLSRQFGVPHEVQLLFHRDSLLEDDFLLADRGIMSGATISLVKRRATGTIVTARYTSHDCCEIFAFSSANEDEAKAAISQRYGFPESELKTIFHSNLLNETESLREQGIQPNSVISVQKDVCEEIQIIVKPSGESSSLSLTVNSTTTILDVKKIIQKEWNVPEVQQTLFLEDVLLNDMDCVSDHHIINFSQLLLVCKVNLSIQSLDSQHAHLNVEHTTTGESLKAMVEEKFGIPKAKQRLILHGRELLSNESLWQCARISSRTVTVVIAKRKLMWIFVKWNDEMINFSVSSSDLVLHLKQKVYEQKNIPVEQQILSYNGRDLRDEVPLWDMKIPKNAVLDLRQSRKIKFVVKISSEKRIPITDFVSVTVAQIKEKVAKLEGIPSQQQKFIFKGQELDDTRQLSECGIQNGSVISVVLMGKRSVMVRSVCGKKKIVKVEHTDRLKDVKRTISREFDLSENLIRIFIDSTEWNDSRTTWLENSKSDSMIYVTRTDMDKFWVFVAANQSITGVVVSPKESFGDVSLRIREELDLQSARVVFMLDTL